MIFNAPISADTVTLASTSSPASHGYGTTARPTIWKYAREGSSSLPLATRTSPVRTNLSIDALPSIISNAALRRNPPPVKRGGMPFGIFAFPAAIASACASSATTSPSTTPLHDDELPRVDRRGRGRGRGRRGRRGRSGGRGPRRRRLCRRLCRRRRRRRREQGAPARRRRVARRRQRRRQLGRRPGRPRPCPRSRRCLHRDDRLPVREFQVTGDDRPP